jgi:sugar lactone lactonase YvrE
MRPNQKSLRHVVCCTTLAALPWVGACSQQTVDPLAGGMVGAVWPKRPAESRVRYLGALTGADDFGHDASNSLLSELIHGPTPPVKMVTPMGVCVSADGSKVAVADVNDHSVHVFDLAAKKHRRLDRWSESGRLESPVAVAWVGDELWTADSKLGAIAVIKESGGGRVIGKGQLKRPASIAYCAANQLCYVVDSAAHKVIAFDRSGRVAREFGAPGAGEGQLNYPSHIAVGSNDTLAVADTLNFRVQQFSLEGSPRGIFGRKGDAAGDLALPKGVAFDAAGNIWVADAHFENVQAFSNQGELLMAFGEEGSDAGEFWLPAGVFIDQMQRLWVADSYNRRVQVFQLL